jgi:hypothetical protein
MAIKFHERNQAVYVGLQTDAGSANKVATASLGSTTAIACTEISSDTTRDTGAFQYLGDSLSRDEYTYTKDTYIDLGITTFQQVLASLTSAINPDTASLWKLFQACGGNIAVAADNTVWVDNASESPDYATADVRFASPDDATNDKLYKFWDLRGTVDVNASLGEVPTLKFALKGNADDPVASAKQTANFGTQVTNVAPSVLYTTVKTAKLLDMSVVPTYSSAGTVTSVTYAKAKAIITFSAPHGLTASLIRLRISGATPATLNGDFVGYVLGTDTIVYYAKGTTGTGTATGTILASKGDTAEATFCFSTLDAPNFFGFDYQRYLTGCDQGFAKGATPTDVNVTMLEPQVGEVGVFNPTENVTKFFAGIIKFGGSSAGTTVAYMWDKLQLATDKQGKVATYLGRDVTFRNTGTSMIFYQ